MAEVPSKLGSLSRSWLPKALVLLSMLAAGAILATPFFLQKGPSGKRLWMVSTHDMVQHFAVMKDFDKVLRSGTLYPRWLPDINNGYGIPWINFYPPGFYYLASLVNSALQDWIKTLLVISVFGFAASGLAFYWLARAFYSRLASIIAALVYMAFPYHVINLYWQGAMPQLLGFIFLPLTLLFAFKAGALGRWRDYAGLGLTYGAYLMTHAPVSFLMTYTLAVYGLVWAAKERDWKVALRIGVGMAIGLLVGSIYLLPAALETRDIQEHFSAIFPYHNSYITLLPLQGFGNLINESFALQTLALIVSILILRVFSRSESKEPAETGEGKSVSSSQTHLWVVMGIATTFMNTSFSIYLSKLLPKIQVATFAWRWLAISSLFTALLVGAALDCLRSRPELPELRLWVWRVAIGAVIAWNLLLTGQGVVREALQHPPFDPPANYVEGGFTPRNSTLPESLPFTERAVIQPPGAAEIVRWEPLNREIAVNVDKPSELRLKTYNFPGWAARIDGEIVALSSDKDGVQLMSVPPGIHNIEVEFVDTIPRRLGTMLFGLGLFIIAGLGALDYRQRRTWRTLEAKAKTDAEPESNTEPDNGAKALHATRRALTVKVSIVVASVVIVALILAGWLSTRSKSSSSMEGKQGTTRSGQARSGISTGVGSEVRLYLERLTSVPVAADERAFDELITALSTRRQDSVETLIQSGRVFRADNDTRIRILEMASGKVKVRVLEGPHIMKDGWIHEGWVR